VPVRRERRDAATCSTTGAGPHGLLGSRQVRALVVVVLCLFAVPAAAEDIASYEVEGESDAAGTDPRTAALDAAFGRAVVAAVGDVLDAETRKTNKAAIDKDVVGRARLVVAKFTVTKDVTESGRRQLTVVVRVDRDKVRERLEALNIKAVAPPLPVAANKAVILLRITNGETTTASYGTAGLQAMPGLGALSAQLRKHGLTILRAPTQGSVRPTGDLPIDDSEADTLGVTAGVESVAIAGVSVGDPVAVRGMAGDAVLVTAHVRMIGKGKKLVGQGMAAVAARGRDASVVAAAVERALVSAAEDVMPTTQSIGQAGGFQGEDTPVAEPGVVLVRVSPKTPYALVAAEVKYLAGARGISRAVLRRMSPGGWVIGVSTTESVQKIASIAKRAPSSGSSVQVRVVGDIVEVNLTGAP
jgi:hypothetical protein